MRKATGSYCTYSIPGKTAALVPEFAVKDLPSAELQPRFLRLQWRTCPRAEHSDDDDDDVVCCNSCNLHAVSVSFSLSFISCPQNLPVRENKRVSLCLCFVLDISDFSYPIVAVRLMWRRGRVHIVMSGGGEPRSRCIKLRTQVGAWAIYSCHLFATINKHGRRLLITSGGKKKLSFFCSTGGSFVLYCRACF